MNFIFNPAYSNYKNDFERIIKNYKNEGVLIGNDNRNVIKVIAVDGQLLNFKSFKKPNPVNRIVYKYFRKSKAQRSFEYGSILQSKGFGTPQPIAYVEDFDAFGLNSSFYISKQLESSFTLREVMANEAFHDRENIIKKYTQFFFQLHENGIEFVDNSSGNTLIQRNNGDYQFFLVDLNRMYFHKKMALNKRLYNFCRLTTDKELISIISKEYARLANTSSEYVYDTIIQNAEKQNRKYHAKKQLKNKLKLFKPGNLSYEIALLSLFL